jgi:polar amino acid transport system substrate-binding protein
MDLGCSFEEGTLSQSCQLLSDDKVDAVIFDAAPLLYFANKQSQPGEFAVVGELFDKQDYGIVMAAGSPLRETINRLILKYKQDGALETILHRYGM